MKSEGNNPTEESDDRKTECTSLKLAQESKAPQYLGAQEEIEEPLSNMKNLMLALLSILGASVYFPLIY